MTIDKLFNAYHARDKNMFIDIWNDALLRKEKFNIEALVDTDTTSPNPRFRELIFDSLTGNSSYIVHFEKSKDTKQDIDRFAVFKITGDNSEYIVYLIPAAEMYNKTREYWSYCFAIYKMHQFWKETTPKFSDFRGYPTGVLNRAFGLRHLTAYDDVEALTENVINEKFDFIHIFGKSKAKVKSSDDLLKIIKTDRFKSKSTMMMTRKPFYFGNIHAVLAYQQDVLTEKITQELFNIVYELNTPYNGLLISFKKWIKKYKIPVDKDTALLLEII